MKDCPVGGTAYQKSIKRRTEDSVVAVPTKKPSTVIAPHAQTNVPGNAVSSYASALIGIPARQEPLSTGSKIQNFWIISRAMVQEIMIHSCAE